MGILLDVITYSDPSGQEIVHRVPENGAADIKWGGQLVVQETQAAVFFRDGRALDVFPPGRHMLTTQNLPILTGLLKLVAGGQTPFQAQVVFVNQKVFADLKWGTPQPIDLTDPDLGWVSLRAFGNFSIRVADPQLFVMTLVGTQGFYDTEQLNSFLKGSIRTHLNNLLGEHFQSYAKIRANFEALAAAMKVRVKDDFARYGVELRDFFIQDISVPPEVQEAFKERARMGALGDLGRYTQFQAAQAIRDAAQNPGMPGSAMGLGAGLGMGAMMPQMMANAFAQPGYAPPPGYPPAPGGQGYSSAPGYPPAPPPGYPPAPGGQGYAPGAPGAVDPQSSAAAPSAPQTTPLGVGDPCPSCQSLVPSGSKFCMNCGHKMAHECPSCHTPAPPGAKFCVDCGTRIE